MIDIKLIREGREIVKENIKKKFQDEKLPLVDEAIKIDLKLLSKADELWAFGSPSAGMLEELYEAKILNIPRRMFTTDCKEVRNGEYGEMQ